MAGMDLPLRAIREQISKAIEVIVQQSRMKDGTRKVTNITEVQGMEGDVIVLQDIFVYEQTGMDENGKIIGPPAPNGHPAQIHREVRDAGHLPAAIGLRRGSALLVAEHRRATSSHEPPIGDK